MSYLSGFCGTLAHARCRGVAVNGVNAETRYLACRCGCHDGDQAVRDRVLALTADLPGVILDNLSAPLDASAEELHRYLDTINAVLRTRR